MRGKGVWLPEGRPIKFGMGTGTSDLIGLQKFTIPQEWVGKDIAVFVACEVKDAKGRVSEEQKNFLDLVESKGGIPILARSLDDAIEALENFEP